MRHPSSVRRQVCLRLRGGEPVVEIAIDTGISLATMFRWKAQALIDAGVNDGVPSVEADELAVAHRRIAYLGGRAGVDPDACALFHNQEVGSPREGRDRPRTDRAAIPAGQHAGSPA
jgi:hypothetical protein